MMNYDLVTVRAHRHRSGEFAWGRAAPSTSRSGYDLTAIVVFSAIGFLASLCFALVFPDALMALLAQMP